MVYLEDRKVRHYTEAERAPLRGAGAAPDRWCAALTQYLRALSCPFAADLDAAGVAAGREDARRRLGLCMLWLCTRALRDDHADLEGAYEEAARALSRGGGGAARDGAVSGFLGALSEAARRAGALGPSEEPARGALGPADRCRSAEMLLLRLRSRMTYVELLRGGDPRALAVAEAAAGGAGGIGAILDAYGSGMDLGSAAADRAAAVLRILHVEDLRDLQAAVNDLLATVQQYTAAPRTDSALGRVGR